MNAYITRTITVLHNKKFRADKKTADQSIKNARKNGRFETRICAIGMSVSNALAIEKHFMRKKFDVKIIYSDYTPNSVFSIEISW